MVTIKDIFIQFSIIFLWFFGSVILIGLLNLPYLILPYFLIFIILKIYLKRRKKIFDFVKDDFQKLGYKIISERPTTFKEYHSKAKLEMVTPHISINGIRLKRYKYMRDFRRIFIAEYKDGNIYELNTFIIHKWNGENKIEIDDIKRFRN